MKLLQGLPIVIGDTPRVLILGSMPSVKSLEQQAYFANPQNLFWSFMADIFEFELSADILQRQQQLIKKNIAIWDVIAACHRPGSLDSNIDKKTLVVNDFVSLFEQQPQLKTVLFNGQAAATIFNKHALPLLEETYPHIQYFSLPSTSPANASQKRIDKLTKWNAVLLNSSK